MLLVIENVFPILAIIIVGIIIGKNEVIKNAKGGISKFVLDVSLPCLAYTSITEKEYDNGILKYIIITLLVTAIIYFIGSIVGYYFGKLFKFDKNDLGVVLICFSSSNTAFLGFPIALSVFGNDVFFYAVIANIILTIYTIILGPIIVNTGDSKSDLKSNMKKGLFTPVMVALILAFISVISHVNFPTMILDSLDMLGSIATPMSLIIIGILLSENSISTLFTDKKVLILSVIKMFIWPVLGFIIISLLNIPNEIKIALILVTVYPTAAVLSPITLNANKNGNLASKIVALTTFFSLITIPIFCSLLTIHFV